MIDTIFKSAEYSNGSSRVVVQYKGKNFYGVALLHPDDKEFGSEIMGCSIAEARAVISAINYELTHQRQALKACEAFVCGCTDTQRFDPESPSAKTVFRQLSVRRKYIKELEAEKADIQDQIKFIIKQKQAYIDRKRKEVKED